MLPGFIWSMLQFATSEFVRMASTYLFKPIPLYYRRVKWLVRQSSYITVKPNQNSRNNRRYYVGFARCLDVPALMSWRTARNVSVALYIIPLPLVPSARRLPFTGPGHQGTGGWSSVVESGSFSACIVACLWLVLFSVLFVLIDGLLS